MIDYVLNVEIGAVEIIRLENGQRVLEERFEGIACYRNALDYLSERNCKVYFFNKI